ncbi:adaptor protein [Moniliophthora roreri MCA 2997]|uniref:Adaptor protein n=1 Tax=Moniliophthora roreri (strain MCA 2997) TaxID=1381753 RepID=V2X5L6_MONRO|nr:adaptor protein [Moniliophthora roreri MCA 2997]
MHNRQNSVPVPVNRPPSQVQPQQYQMPPPPPHMRPNPSFGRARSMSPVKHQPPMPPGHHPQYNHPPPVPYPSQSQPHRYSQPPPIAHSHSQPPPRPQSQYYQQQPPGQQYPIQYPQYQAPPPMTQVVSAPTYQSQRQLPHAAPPAAPPVAPPAAPLPASYQRPPPTTTPAYHTPTAPVYGRTNPVSTFQTSSPTTHTTYAPPQNISPRKTNQILDPPSPASTSPTKGSFAYATPPANRKSNPILDPPSPTSTSPTKGSFVPLWKRNAVSARVANANANANATATATSRGRPLPMPGGSQSAFASPSQSLTRQIQSAFTQPRPPVEESDEESDESDHGGFAHYANARRMERERGYSAPSQQSGPHPMSNTRSLPGGEVKSNTLRFAAMSLNGSDGARDVKGEWPVDLPRLPKVPGRGRIGIDLDEPPPEPLEEYRRRSPSPAFGSRRQESPTRIQYQQEQPPTRSQYQQERVRQQSPTRIQYQQEQARQQSPTRSQYQQELARQQSPTRYESPPSSRPQSQHYSHPQPTSSQQYAEPLSRPQSQHYSHSQPPSRPQSQHHSYSQPPSQPTSRPQSQHYTHQASSQRYNTPPSQAYSHPQPSYPQPSSSVYSQPPRTPSPPSNVPTINIESPAPLGGRDRVGHSDLERMERESEGSSRSSSPGPSVPRIKYPGDVPRITLPDDDVPSIPRINLPDGGDDDNGIPSINVSSGDSQPQPPQIVFEVPGVSVSQGVPSISLPDDDDVGGGKARGGGPRKRHELPPPPVKRPGLLCAGCGGAIVGRIVGAMDMKWHPGCFRCCTCNELLEHISSYEGTDGRPYCGLCYYETHAPKCWHCQTPIYDSRFISLDDPALGKRTYHEQHFFCSECGDPFLSPSSASRLNKRGGEVSFSGDGTYSYTEDDEVGFTVYKGYPYCEACHVRLRLPKCKRCKKPLREDVDAIEALGGKWCWECFRCEGCDNPFKDPAFYERGKKAYCEGCFSILLRNEI